MVLRVSVQHGKCVCCGGRTVEQLVHQNKVVLYGLLVELAEVALPQAYYPVQELEYERAIGVALRHGRDVDVLVADVREGGRAQCE